MDIAFWASSTFSDDGSLTLSPSLQAVREELRESGHVRSGAMRPTGTIAPSPLWIFDRDIPNQTYTKKSQKITT